MVYIENRDEIVITDTDSKILKILDTKNNFKYITQINPSETLDCPVSICVNTMGDIFVGDYNHSKIFVFDEYYDFKHSFGDGVIKKAFSMTVDPENNHLYVSDKRNNVISVWDSLNYTYLHDIKCESPTQSKISNEKLIVAIGLDYETCGGHNVKVKRIIKGENLIRIYNKNSHELEKTIKFEKHFDLRGLCIDHYMNIYTTARELTNSHIGATFLFKFDINGTFLKKFRLNHGNIRDMILYENKIVFSRGKFNNSNKLN